MLKLEIKTGDVKNGIIITLSFSLNTDNDTVQINFEGLTTIVSLEEFKNITTEILKRNFLEIKRMNKEELVCSEQMTHIYNLINSIESYQLLLAGFDVADHIKFTDIFKKNLTDKYYELSNSGNIFETPAKLFTYFQEKLSGAQISIDHSLIIFPTSLSFNTQENVILNLIKYNRIGAINFYYDEQKLSSFLYKPYSSGVLKRGTLNDADLDFYTKLNSYIKNTLL